MTDDLPINPKAPSGSPYSPIVATVARAMVTATRPNVDPDAVTAAPRGQLGQRHVWELYAPQAKAALDASHHAELTEQLQAVEKRIRDLEGDCDSYRKTVDAIDEQANADAPKLAHYAELLEALTTIRDGSLIGSPLHKAAWEDMARLQRQIAREVLAKIGGDA